MFAVEFRVGYESHDVYTYGAWQSLYITDQELVTFELAEVAANEFILAMWSDEDSLDAMTWQIRSIERVAVGEGVNPWPREYIL